MTGKLPASRQSQPGGLRGRRPTGGVLLGALLLVALVAVTYRQALANGFQFDDRPNIVHNPAVRMERPSLGALARAASDSPLGRRPLPYVTFALDWWRGEGEPRVFQWTNLTLHAVDAGLVFALLLAVLARCRGGADGAAVAAAWGGAALWAVHPIQVQAVTYIVQRMTEMACLFTLLAVLLYLQGRTCRRRGRAAALLVSAGLAVVAGGLSKENSWIAPALLLLAELAVVRRRGPLLRSAVEKTVLATLAAGGTAAVTATLWGVGPLARLFADGYAYRGFTMGERLLTQPRAVLFHLSQILLPLPSRFSLEHDFAVSRSWLQPVSTLPALLAAVAVCTAGVVLLRFPGRRRLAGFFVLWVPLALAVEATIVPLELVFEHRMYLPSVGLAGLAALGLDGLLRSPRSPVRWMVGAALVAVVLLLAVSTRAYLPVWRTPATLAERSVRHAPGKVRAWGSLGQAYVEEGRLDPAEAALRRCLQLDPDNRWGLEHLGLVLFDRGRLAEAEEHFRRALRVGPPTPSLDNHLGEVELARGAVAEAEARFRRAAETRPWVAVYHWNQALALEGLGRCAEALAAWRRYLERERDEASRAQVLDHLRRRYATEGGECFTAAAAVEVGSGGPEP